MEARVLIPGQLYRHFKGNLYQIITIGKHSETGEEMVVYQALYGEFQVYIRPVSVFLEKLDLEKYPNVKQEYRFELVKSPYEIAGKDVLLEDVEQQAETVVSMEAKDENDENIIEENKQNEEVEKLYLTFFDAETCKEKLHIMRAIKDDVDLRMLNNIAASMDLPVEEDDPQNIFELIVKNLEQRSRFECNRFR